MFEWNQSTLLIVVSGERILQTLVSEFVYALTWSSNERDFDRLSVRTLHCFSSKTIFLLCDVICVPSALSVYLGRKRQMEFFSK